MNRRIRSSFTCLLIQLMVKAQLTIHCNKNHGEMKGDPEHVDGRFGKAIKFNGVSEIIEIPTP